MNSSAKVHRILVLGIAIIGVFFLNKILVGNQSGPILGFIVRPLSKGFTLVESGVQYDGFYKDKLKSYPEPSKFRSFEYNSDDLEFSGKCSDLYYTVILYDQNIDYRKNPASAKFNQAFECPANKKFEFTIGQNIGLPKGKYYIIFADQGEKGSWYNPK